MICTIVTCPQGEYKDHPGIERRSNGPSRHILVVKDTHHQPAIECALFSNTDWNLIRNCPRTLLKVKPPETVSTPHGRTTGESSSGIA